MNKIWFNQIDGDDDIQYDVIVLSVVSIMIVWIDWIELTALFNAHSYWSCQMWSKHFDIKNIHKLNLTHNRINKVRKLVSQARKLIEQANKLIQFVIII